MIRKSPIHHTAVIAFTLIAAACSSSGSGPAGGGAGSDGSSGLGGSAGASSAATTSSSSQAGSSASAGSSAAAGSSATGGGAGAAGSSALGGQSSVSGGASTGPKTSAVGGGGSSAGNTTGGTTSTGGAATGGRADAGADRDAGPVGGGSGGQAGTGGRPDASPMGGIGGEIGKMPCKASPCVILPLGDSITHGFGSSDDAGYRSGLWKLAVEANQNITFIGSLSNGNVAAVSGKTFPKNHEGHDGATITQITGYVPPKKAFSTIPHIVLLHAGTNDMTSNANPTTAASQLDTAVTNIVAAAPDALVVVAKIVPLGYNNANYTSYVAKIADVVKAHADKGQNVILVDMSTLPSSDIKGNSDVHPTAKGYSDMAELWYGAIKRYLPN